MTVWEMNDAPDKTAFITNLHALKRVGRPEEVARSVPRRWSMAAFAWSAPYSIRLPHHRIENQRRQLRLDPPAVRR